MSQRERGARAVRTLLTDHVTAQMPPALALARTEWGYTLQDLPDLAFVDAYETQVVDDTPQVAVNVAEMRKAELVDLEPGGGEVYRKRYSCRLFLWVKAVEPRTALQVRDDYVVVLQSTLTSSIGVASAGRARVDPSTLRESYSDASRVKGDRWLAGGRVDFELERDETLWRVPLGSANSAAVEATVLPETP